MAINPFPRITGLDLPTPYPSAARADPSVFSNLASIGEALGARREQSEMGDIARGAIDPATGALDIQKFATQIALSGRDPARVLALMEAQSRAKEAQSYREQQLDIAREGRDIQREALSRQGWTFVEPDALSGTPGYARRVGPGGKIETIPLTAPAVPPAPAVTPAPAPAPAPGPRSALPDTGPTLASFNPEEAPPYRVAGPPMPSPQPPATAAPPAAATPPAVTAAPTAAASKLPPEWEAGISTYPASVQETIRGLLTYDRDPYKVPYKDKTQEQNFLIGLQQKFPGWNPQEFARQEERRKQEEKKPTLSPEMAARLGIGGKFLLDMEDETDASGKVIPGIRSRIKSGELSGSYENATMAQVYKGGPGQLRRQIDNGAEGLIRMLTGAGMNKEEAQDYANRYKFSFFSNTAETLDKAEELAATIKAVAHAVETGKASPEELSKILGARRPPIGSEKKEPGPVKNESEANKRIEQAREALQKGWQTREFLIDDLRRRGVTNPERYLGQ